MSTATIEAFKAPTLQQKSQTSAEKIAARLGLNDLKLVNAAVLEAALQEIDQNGDFAQKIKTAFEQLPHAKTRAPRKAAKSIFDSKLVPVGRVENHFIDPFAPPDPFFLFKLYGMHQLHDALDEYSGTELKRSVAEQMVLHPGTKPKTKTKKEDIIAYLIDLVKQSEGEH